MQRELALFAGVGGGILGGVLHGWRTVCAVESDPYARCVLVARQNDGSLGPFPIWDDVRTFDGRPWRGLVDVVSGGFPCQDISVAGRDGDGLDGERSGLWREMARIVCEVGPRFVFVENSPALSSRGLGVVLGDLARLGFDARWGVLGADDCGGQHRRARLWLVARRSWELVTHADELPECPCCGDAWCPSHGEHFADCGCLGPHDADDKGFRLEIVGGNLVAYPAGGRLEGRHGQAAHAHGQAAHGSTAALEQNAPRVDLSNPRAFGSPDAVAYRMERTRAIGNGQVPSVAAAAWFLLGGE